MENTVLFNHNDIEFVATFHTVQTGSCCGSQTLFDIYIKVRDYGYGHEANVVRANEHRQTADSKIDWLIDSGAQEKGFEAIANKIEDCIAETCAVIVILDYVDHEYYRPDGTSYNNHSCYHTRAFAEWWKCNTDGSCHRNPNSGNYVQVWIKYLNEVGMGVGVDACHDDVEGFYILTNPNYKQVATPDQPILHEDLMIPYVEEWEYEYEPDSEGYYDEDGEWVSTW